MTRPITLYTLRKEEVWADSPTNSIEFHEKQDNFRHCSLLFPHGEPMTAADATPKRKYTVPIRHCSHITSAGGKVDEYYALHPQLQEFFERELRRMQYLDVEIVSNIRAEDSRVIQALSEEVRDLKEDERQNRKTITRYHEAGISFATAPLWRRLYVAIFSPNSIFPS